MTKLIKVMLSLLFLALVACNSSESSSAEKQNTPTISSTEAEPMPEKSAEAMEVSAPPTSETTARNTPEQNTATIENKSVKVTPPKVTAEAKAKTTAVEKSLKAEKPSPVSTATTPVSKPSPAQTVQEMKKETATPSKVLTANTTKETPKEPQQEAGKTISHDAWDALLKANVSSSGKVNYAGFKSSQAALDAYLETLKNNVPASTWSRNEKLAYWINAYNAFTVKLIVDNYPLTSITKLHNGKPWDVSWIKIGGKTYSLNNIENDIIRPTFKEPRIHFAVNCAAQSCPPLLNRAWTADNLSSNFAKQTKAFINNSKYNTISASSVEISKIFDWYGVDFGNVVEFLNKYSDTKIEANAKVSFKEYDWTLNN